MKICYYITFFLIGLCLGSFFNVCGMRIPNGESVNKPRSHCPKCGHQLKWYELIPLISFIIQKGKCRECGAKLSWLYPFSELATAILFTVCYHSFGLSLDLIIALTLVSTFILVIVSDLSYLLIPDRFIIIPSIIVIIVNFFRLGILNSLIQIGYGILAFIIMYLIMLLGNKIFNKESMGGADIKLMFLVGLTLDPFLSIMVILLASIIALPVSMFLLIKNREHIIPFGPFIMLSLLIIYFTKLDIKEIFENILNLFN